MQLDKGNMKKLRSLILFTILILVGLQNIDIVFGVLKYAFGLIAPFVLGGCMAFILSVPMSFFERHLFPEGRLSGKLKPLKRTISLVLTVLAVFGIMLLVIFVVVPDLASTFVTLTNRMPAYISQLEEWLNALRKQYPEILTQLANVDLEQLGESAFNFLRSWAGSFVNSTFVIASGIASGVMNFFIGFVFACYILLNKEKLSLQFKKLMYAFLPEKAVKKLLKVFSLTHQTFSNFLTGQCLEAVILGFMFFVAMSLFQLPYALLVGILIAFTALIPIFGAFIGCAVGAFLILMISPVKALIFLVMFIVLQQIEGNLIYPHVVGNSVGLPSMWVLVAVTLGGNMMGIIGMIIFIPVCSVLYSLVREAVWQRLEGRNEIQ